MKAFALFIVLVVPLKAIASVEVTAFKLVRPMENFSATIFPGGTIAIGASTFAGEGDGHFQYMGSFSGEPVLQMDFVYTHSSPVEPNDISFEIDGELFAYADFQGLFYHRMFRSSASWGVESEAKISRSSMFGPITRVKASAKSSGSRTQIGDSVFDISYAERSPHPWFAPPTSYTLPAYDWFGHVQNIDRGDHEISAVAELTRLPPNNSQYVGTAYFRLPKMEGFAFASHAHAPLTDRILAHAGFEAGLIEYSISFDFFRPRLPRARPGRWSASITRGFLSNSAFVAAVVPDMTVTSNESGEMHIANVPSAGTHAVIVPEPSGLAQLVDLDDSDALLSVRQGDIDSDGEVSILDFLAFSEAFGASCAGDATFYMDPPHGFAPAKSDFDSDGTVSIIDYMVLGESFGLRGFSGIQA
jgi:hypothetical protein